jgi:hypothetical protein
VLRSEQRILNIEPDYFYLLDGVKMLMNDASLSSDSVFQRAEGLLAAEAGDELMMMRVEHGLYSNLNSVGSRIWALLEQPLTHREIATALLSEYDVSPQTVEQELHTFLSGMYQRGLVVVSDVEAS